MRALVVHRDPTAASELADALQGTSGPIEAVVLHDPTELAAALREGGFDAVVYGDAERDGIEAALAAARDADVALVLTAPDAHRPADGRVAHEPDPRRLAETVAREHHGAQDRRAARRARRLLDGQRTLTDRLAAEPSPEQLLGDALELVAQIFDAVGGVAWETTIGDELRARRTWGKALAPNGTAAAPTAPADAAPAGAAPAPGAA
ncbi:hypothetical protein Q7L65_17020, partial [Conexibacter sp. CPCC 206217]